MTTTAAAPLVLAGDALTDAVAGLRAVSDHRAGADIRLAAVVACESVSRQLEQLMVELVAGLDRDGVFTTRGYPRPALAVADLLGWDTPRAARLVRAAEHIIPRTTLDGQVLTARLPHTAAAFAGGQLSLRHVEVIVDALATPAAQRLTPSGWAGAEDQLAHHAQYYRPRELQFFARDLITTLDQDGPEPDDGPQSQLNELHLSPTTTGGKIKGQLDPPTFSALATALDALSKPTAEDQRPLPERRADALGELARHALDTATLPERGGQRPHLSVIIPLEELETRARAALLDYGASLTPTELRVLACDAQIIPVVLGGAGQPLDLGRAMRTVPTPLRRAIAARDRGCAFPGCDRPPSWSDVHHIREWQHGGETEINNLVMLCRIHHRLLHHPGWTTRIHHGQPEFTPPKWIDINQTPRRKPPPPRPEMRTHVPGRASR